MKIKFVKSRKESRHDAKVLFPAYYAFAGKEGIVET